MKQSYILAIDQGTTGTRAFLYDRQARIKASAYQEFRQYYPRPGWVEHDADEIWASCVAVIKRVLRRYKIRPEQIAGIGITNQRETTVLWDRKTGKPVARAIVWQCRRTAEICRQPRLQRAKALVGNRTGLVLDPYFSATKVRWLLDQQSSLRTRARDGRLCFGTIDAWLIWKLTGGAVHATDMTNASRTLLFNIHKKTWDDELLKLFGVPGAMLPQVNPSGHEFGRTSKKAAALPAGIPILSVMGDQQAALYGQGCFTPGSFKNTYGTGCFVVLNTGDKRIRSRKGMLTTLACDGRGQPVYALEGAIFMAGAVVQWLRDELKLIRSAGETETLAKSVTDCHDVYFVPAFTGLGAPHWDAQARGVIAGLTRGANRAHLVRAALESIAYQTKDVCEIMRRESGFPMKELKVDGGACQNDFLMQFQSDILNAKVRRPKNIDTTVLGAALLAGVQAGLWKKTDIGKVLKAERVFQPKLAQAQRERLVFGWKQAVRQACCHD